MIGLVTEAIALDLLPVQFIFCLVFLIAFSSVNPAREKNTVEQLSRYTGGKRQPWKKRRTGL